MLDQLYSPASCQLCFAVWWWTGNVQWAAGKKVLKQTETKLNVKHILVWSWPYGCNWQTLHINLYIMKKLFLLYNENIEKLQVPRAQGAVFTLPVCLTKHTKQDIQFTVTTEQYYKSSHSFKMLTSDYVWHFHFYLIFDQLTNWLIDLNCSSANGYLTFAPYLNDNLP